MCNIKCILFIISFVLFGIEKCSGVIFHLNDTMYEELPPLFEMENYDSCIEETNGTYCVANLELYTDSPNKVYTLIQEYSQHTVKHYNYSIIDRGVCVTKTCRNYTKNSGLDVNKDLESALEGCLNEILNNKYGLMANLRHMDCTKQTDDNKIHIDKFDLIVLVIFIVLIVLTLVGSYCDFYRNEKSEEKFLKGMDFLLCFSVIRNIEKLTASDLSDPRLNLLKGFHFIRTLSTGFIVYGHTFILFSHSFTSDPHNFEKAYETLFYRVIMSASSIVQMFFFMSGFFLTYILQIFSETYNITWKTIPLIIFERWWRLTPSAVIMIAFMATWMRHLSHGPLWNIAITNGPTEQCRRFFWAHLFYYNNYLSEDVLCAFQTWHIAADMQLFVLGLIVHFLIRNRSRRLKIIILLSLILVGIVIPPLFVWLQDLEAFFMQTPEFCRTLNAPIFLDYHVHGHNHLPCFVMGMASGYWIYGLQQKKIDYSKSKIGRLLCWFILPILLSVLYCGTLFYYDGHRPHIALRMLYAAMNKPMVGIGNMILLTAFVFKLNRLSRPFMEWSGWVILSKLSYGVYLLHGIFIHVALGVRTRLTPVSFLNMFYVFIGILVVNYLFALLFYLLVEAPTSKFLKLILKERVKRKVN